MISKPRIARNQAGPQWCVLLPPVGGDVGQLAIVSSFSGAIRVLDTWLRWRRRVLQQHPYRAWLPGAAYLN